MLEERLGDQASAEALVRAVGEEFERYAKVKKNIPEEAHGRGLAKRASRRVWPIWWRAIWASMWASSRICWKR